MNRLENHLGAPGAPVIRSRLPSAGSNSRLLSLLSVVSWAVLGCGGGGSSGSSFPPPQSTSVEIFSNPFDPRILGVVDDAGDRVEYQGLKDSAGFVVRATSAVVSPAGQDPVHVELDAEQRPTVFLTSDGSGVRLGWLPDEVLHVQPFDAYGNATGDAWVDLATMELIPAPTGARLPSPWPDVEPHAEPLGVDPFITVDVDILDCARSPSVVAADSVARCEVVFDDGRRPFVVEAHRNGDSFMVAIPRDLTQYEWAQAQCEQLASWAAELCGGAATSAAMVLACEALPSLPSSAACEVAVLAASLYCLDPERIAAELCRGPATLIDPWTAFWGAPTRTIQARASVRGCDGLEARESQRLTVLPDANVVRLSVDGCHQGSARAITGANLALPCGPACDDGSPADLTVLDNGRVAFTWLRTGFPQEVQTVFLTGGGWSSPQTLGLSTFEPALMSYPGGGVFLVQQHDWALLFPGASETAMSPALANLNSTWGIFRTHPPTVVPTGTIRPQEMTSATFDTIARDWKPELNTTGSEISQRGTVLPDWSGGYQLIVSEPDGIVGTKLVAYRRDANGALVGQQTLGRSERDQLVLQSDSRPSGATLIVTGEQLFENGLPVGTRLRTYDSDAGWGPGQELGTTPTQVLPQASVRVALGRSSDAVVTVVTQDANGGRECWIYTRDSRSGFWQRALFPRILPFDVAIAENGNVLVAALDEGSQAVFLGRARRPDGCAHWQQSTDPTIGGALPSGTTLILLASPLADGRFVVASGVLLPTFRPAMATAVIWL